LPRSSTRSPPQPAGAAVTEPAGGPASPAGAELRTRRGRIRPALSAAISALALLALWLSGGPLIPRLALALGVVAAGVVAACRHRSHRVRLPGVGAAMLDGVSGTLKASAVTPFFVSLELESPTGKRRRAGIFRDELPPEAYRALLAWLRSG